MLLNGLVTLDLRVRRQSETAATLADRIAAHPKVRACRYPGRADHPQHEIARRQMTGGGNEMIGGGTLVAFDLGSQAAAFNFLNALQIVDISNNLGDARSMATHPTTTTHRSMTEEQRLEIGLTAGWVRLSVGLEGAGDLCARHRAGAGRRMNRDPAIRRAESSPVYEATTRGITGARASRPTCPRSPTRARAATSGPIRSRSRTTATRPSS